MTQHARLSPSASSRWLHCPPSLLLEEAYPDREETDYMREGTLAHAIAEMKLKAKFYLEREECSLKLEEYRKNELYSREMEDATDYYVDLINELFIEYKTQDEYPAILAEVRVTLDKYFSDCFGTADCIILTEKTIHVIDFKYGKGVSVSAKDNTQMMLYALGAYDGFSPLLGSDQEEIKMTICQPRIENISTATIKPAELIKWGKTTASTGAKLALEGKGELVIGKHCTFCKHFARCKAQYEHHKQLATYEFCEADSLKDTELGEILEEMEALVKWTNAIKDYVTAAIEEGKQIPGWKLVAGRGRRVITDETKLLKNLLKKGYAYDDLTELKALTKLEKILSKSDKAVLKKYIEKKEGKPSLVRESDKRPSIKQNLINEF